MKTTPRQLDTSRAPALCRGMIARGLAAGEPAEVIQPGKGMFGGGLIRGFAVVTRGEALGHGYWLDSEFVAQTLAALNLQERGVKSRFTHPDLSADGLGKKLGRSLRGVQQTDLVRADLHFYKSAARAPEGDLSGYVIGLAGEDPEGFGASIVYLPDQEAEREFFEEHGGKVIEDAWGTLWDPSNFQSPDPKNAKNLPHARLQELHAVDVVDDPAANPSGMFSRSPLVHQADALLSFATGLVAEPPRAALSIHPQRAKVFLTKWLARNGLELKKKEPPMPKPTKNQAGDEPKKPEEKPADDPKPVEKETAADDGAAQYRAQLKRYVAAFGAEKGTAWYLEGKSFEACQTEHAKQLGEENERLKRQLATSKQEEKNPLSMTDAATKATKGKGLASCIRIRSTAPSSN